VAEKSQKAWLAAAKRVLSARYPDLTWDGFAELVGIDPRAFKTYRMPPNSADYRKMPPLAEAAIQARLSEVGEPNDEAVRAVHLASDADVIPALAALIVRQARVSLIEGRMVSGNSRIPGLPVGLTSEDRRAMALVSRVCLKNGLPDHGAEIHQLLAICTTPLGDWLSIQEVAADGLNTTCLIHAEDGIPTSEAEELSSGFTGLTANLEEQLFSKFIELIGRYPVESGHRYYTTVREFVVRHPVCTQEEIREVSNSLPSPFTVLLQQQFYESVPDAWAIGDGVPLCEHCGNAMKHGRAGLLCRTQACSASHEAAVASYGNPRTLNRVTRGVRQYWVEPGRDEVEMCDVLRAKGHTVDLYPFRDRVDLAVGGIGVDLKMYASPETLGRRFQKGIGGLSHYAQKLVVIPDWLVAETPSYLDRLRSASQRPELRYMTVADAVHFIDKEATRA
jgi:hypothetical protein